MIENDLPRAAVLKAVAVLNETKLADEQVAAGAETSLADLSSLDVTNLLVGVEEAVHELLGTEISMTDERTLELIMSAEASPLRSVGDLIAYVGHRIDETRS